MQHRSSPSHGNLRTNTQPNQFQNIRPYITPRGGYRRGSNYQKYNSAGWFSNDGNEEHWCETCDRGFWTADLLEKHKKQHQKCNIDGCQFIAHPKVITNHIQMQHSTGLFKKIGNLNNPEEIKRWREERKRRYPTKENIDKKYAEVKEKLERGEKMGLHEKYFNGCSNNTRNNRVKRPGAGDKRKNNYDPKNSKQNKLRKISNSNKEKQSHPRKENNIKLTIENNTKLKPFAGIHDLVSDNDEEEQTGKLASFCLIDDEESSHIIKESLNSSKPEICGALSSLLCNYRSSDEDNEEISDDVIRESENTLKSTPKPSYIEINNMRHAKLSNIDNNKSVLDGKNVPAYDDSDSAPEETNVVKKTDNSNYPSDVKDKPSTPATFARKHRPEQNKRSFTKSRPIVPSTLLQKLLFKEMRQERNMVLQCIRYIVKNNYFNK